MFQEESVFEILPLIIIELFWGIALNQNSFIKGENENMQFNTYLFILAFLPLTIVGYFLINKVSNMLGKALLIGASIFFYGYAGITELKWLLLSVGANYLVVLSLGHAEKFRKTILWLGITFNVLLLFFFKYLNFTVTIINEVWHKEFVMANLVLPLGISFFTFQQIAYIVDAYHNKVKEYTVIDYMLYVVYFPKILMGPIVKPSDIIPQFNQKAKKTIDTENLVKGISMFGIGLFKKVIFADTFAKAVVWGFSNIQAATSMDLILVMLAYTFQIYFDFSGYSDMAIGVSCMLNIELPINFDSPYKAYSIRDFWKRWHISLTKFLTEYLYIPLGGNRKGKLRTYLNTIIVFLVSGLWHGANWTFLLWGLLHGMFSIFDRITEKFRKNIHPAMQWMATFFVVNILWLLFRANSVSEWLLMLKRIGSMQSTAISEGLLQSFVLPETNSLISLTHMQALNAGVRGFSMIVFYIFSLVLCLCFENAYKRKYTQSVGAAMCLAVMMVFCLTCLSSESVFVYFNF